MHGYKNVFRKVFCDQYTTYLGVRISLYWSFSTRVDAAMLYGMTMLLMSYAPRSRSRFLRCHSSLNEGGPRQPLDDMKPSPPALCPSFPVAKMSNINFLGAGNLFWCCQHTPALYYNTFRHFARDRSHQYLQNYWTDKVRGIKNIRLNTPEDKKRSCAIANVAVEGYSPQKLAETLFENYKIWTVAINRPTVKGCRITLNIYTSTEDLDKLVFALKELSKT